MVVLLLQPPAILGANTRPLSDPLYSVCSGDGATTSDFTSFVLVVDRTSILHLSQLDQIGPMILALIFI